MLNQSMHTQTHHFFHIILSLPLYRSIFLFFLRFAIAKPLTILKTKFILQIRFAHKTLSQTGHIEQKPHKILKMCKASIFDYTQIHKHAHHLWWETEAYYSKIRPYPAASINFNGELHCDRTGIERLQEEKRQTDKAKKEEWKKSKGDRKSISMPPDFRINKRISWAIKMKIIHISLCEITELHFSRAIVFHQIFGDKNTWILD